MRSANPPTGSTEPPSQRELRTLAAEVRQLWATPLVAEPVERERLLFELTALDLDVERLVLRASGAAQTQDDRGSARSCAERLARLARRWRVTDPPHDPVAVR